jgi:Tol biopolymer transport system component
VSVNDGGLSRFEHDELRDVLLAGTQSIRPAGTRRAHFVAAAVALLLIGALVGGVVAWTLREPSSPAVVSGTPAVGTAVWSGWVAFSAGEQDGDIYLVKAGAPAHRVLGSDTDNADQVCPAFSPDGSRIVAGQVTDDGSGEVSAALVVADLSADGELTRTTTLALEDVTKPPCAVWSADGRWLAFAAETRGNTGVDQVWVVDTTTNRIRRLTGLWATDLEWAPNSSELFIASSGIVVYSTVTDQTRPVDGTLGAEAFSFSPDGRSLAVQHHEPGASGTAPVDLLLMAPDGSDQRTLVSGYRVGFGIGPVWSPDGNRVVFQRRCATYVDESGTVRPCLEEHEVVVVTVSDHDPAGPSGTQTVLAPPRTTVGGESGQWFPYSVSWSPDSRTLLYLAWSRLGTVLLAVPMDSATPPVILGDAGGVAGHGGEPWNTSFQSWSQKP